MIRFIKFLIICYLFLCFNILSVKAQLITTVPIFPKQQDSVLVTFKSDEGSRGLANYTGDIYAHTGVITNLSSSSSDWKYVKSSWGQNIPTLKLTKIGNNIYQLKIAPNIRSFYNVPVSETILKMAFVFRSDVSIGGSYLEGKTSDGGDIFVDVYDAGLNIQLVKPNGGFVFVNPGDTIPLQLNAVNADSLFLFKDFTLLKSDTASQILDTFFAPANGKVWIRGLAKNATEIKIDSFFVVVNSAPDTLDLPPGITDGINYIDSQTVVLCLFAPGIDFVYVVGDFNNWEPGPDYNMHISSDKKYFWLKIENLIPEKEYIFQYLVNGSIAVGDPYANKVSDPWNDSYISSATYPDMLSYPVGKAKGIATVLQTNQKSYNWKNNFNSPPESQNLVIFELLVRDFNAKHSFKAVIDSLHYLKNLGINAIELMPVSEFEGNNSWGYNPNYYFAVDKYYGRPDYLKDLIDSCHSLGIAVIMDVVYNHSFGTSPYVMMWWDAQNNRPAYDNPFFNPIPKHDFNVGYDLNHESWATKKYISRALQYWTENFKFDGFRFDLSKGFTQNNTLGNSGAMANFDASRIHILESYADSVWKINPKAYIILEHFADNAEETDLSSRGMMLWGNLNNAYNEGAMGYNNASKSDFSWISYKKRGWVSPHLVGYMESHDEERAMYKCSQYGNASGSYDIKNKEIYMTRASLNAVFFLTIPGPKMIWQFGELGYDISINENGRTGEKPIYWEYANDKDRWNNYLIYNYLNKLKKEEAKLFNTNDFTLNLNDDVKTIYLSDSFSNSVIVGNYNVETEIYELNFPHDGVWFDYFSGEQISITGLKSTFQLQPGEYHLFIDKSKLKPELAIPALKPSAIIKGVGFLQIYPNPSSSDITFYINTPIDSEISIYDISGKLMGIKSVIGTAAPQRLSVTNINCNLRAGVYFCRIVAGDNIEVKKFIIL